VYRRTADALAQELYLLGIGLDMTARDPIPNDIDNSTTPPSPILLVYTTGGVMVAYHFINQNAPGPYPFMNRFDFLLSLLRPLFSYSSSTTDMNVSLCSAINVYLLIRLAAIRNRCHKKSAPRPDPLPRRPSLWPSTQPW
jgi:hypothetical protein